MNTGASILVVDDDDSIRSMLRFLLETDGHVVSEAIDGARALGALAASSYDLVLLDLMMPNVDGFTVLRTLQDHDRWGDRPVMMLTCRAQEDDFLEGWRLGADEYVTKPFEPMELLAKVELLLTATPSLRRARRDAEVQKAMLLKQVESVFPTEQLALSR